MLFRSQSLQWAIEEAKSRGETLVVAYLDFENAFNSTDHEALWAWLERIGVPDVDLLKSLYEEAHYRAELPYGTTANIPLTRGKKQGDLISPLLFEHGFEVYLRALEACRGGVVRLVHRPKPGKGFADDVALVTTSRTHLQRLLDVTAGFCGWSGMRVKLSKSVLTGFDFALGREADASGILYQGQPLRHLPATESFRYLGVRISLTGSFRDERRHVLDAVQDLRRLVKGHQYNLDQMVGAMQSVASSRFRYSAPLVPWSDAQLDKLHASWIGLAKTAWRLPPGFPAAPLSFPASQGGIPVPHPKVYLVQALATHLEQLVALPDELRAQTVRAYRQLCLETGCNTAQQLADTLSAERRPRQCPIARFLRVCGQLGLEVRLPKCLSLGPGEEETSWQGLLARIRASAQLASASEQARADFMMVQKRWTAIRLTLVRGGYAQPRMLIRDAKATQPQWRCEAFRKPSGWLMQIGRAHV